MDRGAWRATVYRVRCDWATNTHTHTHTHTHTRAWSLSLIWLFATPWTVAHQAPLSMEFSSQEYWSGLSFPSPRDLPDSGTEPGSPASAGGFFTTEPPGLPEFIAVCASFKWNHTVFVLCQILCTHSSDWRGLWPQPANKQTETDEWTGWNDSLQFIAEKPAPLTCMRAGSEGRFSVGRGRSPCALRLSLFLLLNIQLSQALNPAFPGSEHPLFSLGGSHSIEERSVIW